MAEVINDDMQTSPPTPPPSPPGPSAKPGSAKGMRMRFNDNEELILLKEVVACKAHISAFGSVQKKFEQTAQAINANPHFRFEVKSRGVQDKFNKMVKDFRKEESRDRQRSGTGGDMSAKDEMLSGIVEAVDSMRETEEMEKEEATKAESRKLEAGRRVLASATGVAAAVASADETAEEKGDGDSDDETTPRGPKRCRKMAKAVSGDGGLAEFGASMRDAEMAKVALEQQKLAFERKRHDDLIKERAADREQHAADREANAKNDMDRLKAMLDFAVTSIRSATEKTSNSK